MKFLRSRYSPEDRMRIAREYMENEFTAAETAKIYGIGARSLERWVQNLRMSKKKCNFVVRKRKPEESKQVLPVSQASVEIQNTSDMKPKSVEELERELARVQKELAYEKMRVIALNTLIDVAERNGMPVRKKSGAKQ